MIKIKDNKNILEYLLENNYYINSPCSGKKICGKCKIKFHDNIPEVTNYEKNLLSKIEIDDNIRLACMHKCTIPTHISIIDNDISSINVVDDITVNYNFEYKTGYGIAIDIGSTTIAIKLYNLENGINISSINFINPQSRYAADIISRIAYASNEDGLNLLNNLITSKINEEIKRLLIKSKIDFKDLKTVAIAGNTLMNHLLLKTNPSSLGQFPFTPIFLESKLLEYHKVFNNHDINANVFIFPGFSAFVGGDILSGAYNLNMQLNEQNTILIDLGTNGEIILGNKDKLITTSAAAGPAFEAINIACGCGAINGAINTFNFKNNPAFTTINNEKALGICGSAVIALSSELLINNLIDETGFLKENFYLTDNIYFSPKDVREVQLAKSAIRSSIELLLNEAKLDYSHIKEVYIAGGFGKHIKSEYLINIGLLPKEFNNKIKIVGNSSLSGAVKFLFQNNVNLDKIKESTTQIFVNESEEFQDLFVKYLNF